MTPVLERILSTAVPYSLPLATPFRGVTHREGVLLRGPSGWGEFAPFLEYDDETCARWLAFAIEAAFGDWPNALRDEIPVNAIVPAVDPARTTQLVDRAIREDGCTTIKVKVAEIGQSLDDDVARVAAVKSALTGAGAAGGRIRIDANAGWSRDEAITAIRELDAIAAGLEYVEQPCATLAEMVQVRRSVAVPIAADELVRSSEHSFVASAHESVDVLVMKPTHLGGVVRALDLSQLSGLPVVVSGSMDSAIGLSAAIALAAALPTLPYACGLGTGALLAQDLVARPLRPSRGLLPVTRSAPDANAIATAAARMSGARGAWWLSRLTRAWHAGAARLAGDLRGS